MGVKKVLKKVGGGALQIGGALAGVPVRGPIPTVDLGPDKPGGAQPETLSISGVRTTLCGIVLFAGGVFLAVQGQSELAFISVTAALGLMGAADGGFIASVLARRKK